MGLLGDLLAEIDNRKRVAANSVRGLLADPVGHLGLLGARYAEQNLPTMREAQDAESVMPGMGDPFRQKIENLAMNSGLLGMTVYHGSPHRFDKFDASKIGTGEGAQAYGHGLYFAEKPGTAGYYKDVLKDKLFDSDPQKVGELMFDQLVKNSPYGGKVPVGSTRELVDKTEFLNRWKQLRLNWWEMPQSARTEVEKTLSGHLYKVDLPDDAIAKMLDWDAPLSKQPKVVREALVALGEKLPDSNLRTGGQAYGLAASRLRPEGTGNDVRAPDVAAAALAKLGIPGIKYLDAGSRGAGTGTRNFVVFPGNEGLLKILERE